MDISGRRTREPSVRSLSIDRLLADAHHDAIRASDKRISDRINYQMLARESSKSPVRRSAYVDGYSGRCRKPASSSKQVLRLDSYGREKERRKVSNRENYVDTGPVSAHMEDQLYEYDSCSENTVQYLNDADPDPVKLLRSPERKSHRSVDTVIPTVPRLDFPFNGLNGSLESRDEDTKQGAQSPPTSGRSEKRQRTLKNISLNEREPFPGVRARIAKQREREHQVRSRDQQVSQSANSNNNAAEVGEKEDPVKLVKSSHTEEDVVQLNSSLESVVVRPIKRKVATAPEVPNKTRAPPKRPSAKATASSVTAARSKSADGSRVTTAAKWVDKTPGKGRSMSSGRGGGRKVSQEVIRPDSWRKGMAIVRREIKQRPGPIVTRDGSDDSQPSTARSEKSVRSTQSGERFRVDSPSPLPSSAQQVLMELRHPEPEPHAGTLEPRSQVRSTRPKRALAKAAEHDIAESIPKQRHYDAESVKEFMIKKRREKRQQELEEKRKREEEERAKKEKLKMLQDHSRRVVAHKYTKPSAIVAPAPRDSTFTAGIAPGVHVAPAMDGVWTPVVNSTSYTVTTEAAAPEKHQKSPEESVISETDEDEEEEDGEVGDSTLTEADLRAETPTKQHSRPSSKSSTPRSVRGSPLLARTRAVEEEIEQLVQAAKQRNQSARQIQAQGTPLKQIDQLCSLDTTTTSSENRRSSPSLQQRTKSARILSLAQTTAQLMAKMSMLQADLENSMSRSNSRVGSSYGGLLNNSFSPRDVAVSPVQKLPYGYSSREPVREETESESATEDYCTQTTQEDSTHSHSTVTSDDEPSEAESELSSLDLRIRAALSRPNKVVAAYTKPQVKSPKEIIKPLSKVSRTLTFEERGDGHSVINTYLRKLQADREAISSPGSSRSTPSTCAITTCVAVPVKSTSVFTMTVPTLTTLSSTGIQTDTPHTTHVETLISAKENSFQPAVAGAIHEQVPSRTTATPHRSSPLAAQMRAPDVVSLSSTQHPQTRNLQVPTLESTYTTIASSQSSYSHPAFGQSRPPPAYTSNSRAGTTAQDRRISPAGLELALSTGISMLEGINQQHVQLTDVERTRFSTLAQQETVALAQILKGNKDRQEQQMLDLRHRIRQEELEAEKKLADFKREAELANKRREEVEKQSEKESYKMSTEATQRVLEAQKESTKAFTEAARILEERRERLANTEAHLASSTQTVVDSIRLQNEAVAASLTTLVDQQRQQNMEMLRVARREPQLVQNGELGEGWLSPRRISSRSPRDRKSPRMDKHREMSRSPKDFTQSSRELTRHSRDILRSSKDSTRSSRDSSKSSDELNLSARESVRSPKDSSRSPRDSSTSPRESSRSPRDLVRSPKGAKSPRSRKLRSPKDRPFQAISERSDVSRASSRGSDETIQTASVSYSNDFGSDKSSYSESPSQRDSPPIVASHSSVSSGVARRVLESTDSSIPTDIDSAPSPIKSSSHTDSVADTHSRALNSKSSDKNLSTQGSGTRPASLVSTQASNSSQRGDNKRRYSESSQSASPSSPTSVDSSLHKVVLGAVKEVFKDAAPAQLQSEQFIDKLKSVLYTLKEGGVTPTALSTPRKQSPMSSPTKPTMVAPLSPRIDKRLSMRRPGSHRSSHFAVDSESDESQSFQETASDTDQECQLSALRHHLEETKRRHAIMKKARQHEFQRKQNAYKKQIEYYEEDMERMKREMDDLAALHMASNNASANSQNIRPQIKQPRAPSSSGSDTGKQRHSSGASDADLSTLQPSVIQKPLVGKLLGQLSSGRVSSERRRSDSGQSADSEIDQQREKTPEYGEDFDTDSRSKVLSKPSSNSLQGPEAKEASDTRAPDTDGDNTYSNGFEDSVRSSDSISESIANSISESLQSSRRASDASLSLASDLLRLDESPIIHAASAQASPEKTDFLEVASLLDLSSEQTSKPKIATFAENGDIVEGMRSRSLSAASSHTITEAKSRSRSVTPTRSKSRSRSASPISRRHSQSASPSFRSRSPGDKSRSLSNQSRSSRQRSRSRSYTDRSRSPSDRSRSLTERSRSPFDRSRSPTDRSRSPTDRSRSPTDRSRSPTDRSRSFSNRSRSPTDRSRSPTDRSRSPIDRSRSLTDKSSVRPSRSLSRKSISKTPSRSSRSRSPSPTISEASIVSEVASVAESVKETTQEEAPLLDLGPAGDSQEPPTPPHEREVLTAAFGEDIKTYSEAQVEDAAPPLVDLVDEVTPRPSVILKSSLASYASEFEDAQSEKSADTVTSTEEKNGSDQRIDQSPAEQDLSDQLQEHKDRQSIAITEKTVTEDESILDELMHSAPESSQHEAPLLSLKEELLAALEVSSSTSNEDSVQEEVPGMEAVERLAESTPRLNDSDAEAREQRDFDELEKLVKETASTESSADSSRISFDSKSPDFLEFSTKSNDFQQRSEGSPSVKEAGKEDDRSEEESELEKAISTAAAAVESFADLDIDDMDKTESQADVGVSVIEETTPRSLLSLESSADDLLDSECSMDDGQITPKPSTPPPGDSMDSGETTPRVASPDTSRLEADRSEKSIQDADEHQLDAATSAMISKSFDSVLELWKVQREEFRSEPPLSSSSSNDSSPVVPTLVLKDTTAAAVSPSSSAEVSPVKEAALSPSSITKDLGEEKPKDTTSEDKSSSSTSLLGSLPPLAITTAKTVQLAAAKSPPDSHSSSSSEESMSPQRSPTKLSFVEEARHEQWAQLDKEIDNVFGASDNDWFDDDLGMGAESKPVSVIPTREILNRVVIPEPVFVVPHEEAEVKVIARSALDIFWQARRCGESWTDLETTSEFLETKDKLELEASSTVAFKQFMFDLIREMLSDIYQNESGIPVNQRVSGGPLNRYFKHRQPPTTLDEVQELIDKQICPAVTGKLVHPTKSSRAMPVTRNKRRDKVDTILIQELREEEASWLYYTQDEGSVKEALVEDVFKVLLDDSITAVLKSYNIKYGIRPMTEL
ncbi:centrosome-associated protein 350-like [Watersipora subatra]|uniref:centrosome-associated protein 350-like n=1 Tax=Watersipora subatra TaxID=2589382 RepID=UPI00355B89B4